MTKNFHRAALAAGAILLWGEPAAAASDADIAAIRQQVEGLRADYEARIRLLEDRLRTAEDAARRSETAVSASPAVAPRPVASAPMASSAPASSGSFNPAISAVLNGTFGHFSRNPDSAKIPGFVMGPEADIGTRGFSLGESEVSLSANVDHTLFANLTLAFSRDDEVAVEEGFIQTTSLPFGFTVKAGRFFSGIGYTNEKHAHEWAFVDAALPYRAFLANQYGDDGIQLRWLAPTDLFLEFGAEAFRGDAFPAGNAANHGKGSGSLFVHLGDDFNASSSWLAGFSVLQARANNRTDDADVYDGRETIGIASAVYKWAPNGDTTQRNLTVSGEYFVGDLDGSFNGTSVDSRRSGWYAQAVYQFAPRWSVGLRHDEVSSESVDPALAGSALDDLGHSPRRNTALLEFRTSEFGRFRLQYSRDDTDVATNDELLAQYTIVFGPHGAHRF